MRYIAVVTMAQWAYTESANLKGYPAHHVVAEATPGRTLCGRDPNGWKNNGIIAQALTENDQFCKRCFAIYCRQTADRGTS